MSAVANKKVETLKIKLSDRAPVSIDPTQWPVVARSTAFAGGSGHACQANEEWTLMVREHADGRRIVYGAHDSGPGGMPLNWKGAEGGFLLVKGEDILRALKRVAGIIGGSASLVNDCLSDLPPEEI